MTFFLFFRADIHTYKDGQFGKYGGNAWDDMGMASANSDITAIEVYSGARINGIRVKYGEHWGNMHGRSLGTKNLVDLGRRERITSVQGNKCKPACHSYYRPVAKSEIHFYSPRRSWRLPCRRYTV